MPNESPPARSQGDTERQFPAAIRRARREQAGEIRAGREQHQQGERGHAVKKSADEVTFVGMKSGTDQPQGHSGFRGWILLRQLGRDRTQILRSLLGRHAWLKPAKHRQRMARPVLQVLRVDLIHNGYPVVRPFKSLRAVKLRRGHAQHRERIFAEPHLGPDHAGISVKCASPEAIAQHHIGR